MEDGIENSNEDQNTQESFLDAARELGFVETPQMRDTRQAALSAESEDVFKANLIGYMEFAEAEIDRIDDDKRPNEKRENRRPYSSGCI